MGLRRFRACCCSTAAGRDRRPAQHCYLSARHVDATRPAARIESTALSSPIAVARRPARGARPVTPDNSTAKSVSVVLRQRISDRGSDRSIDTWQRARCGPVSAFGPRV